MIILTSDTAGTYKAQIRSAVATGFKQLYTASCTMGPEQAAKAVVEKYFNQASAQTVRRLTDPTEIKEAVGDFFEDSKRKQVFQVWAFDQKPVNQVNKVLAVKSPDDGLTVTLAALENQRQILISKEEEFLDGTLVNRLKIGLHCLKAHVLFAVTNHAARGARKSSSRRDELSAPTFESWLADSAPWLKKPTAYKYMTALKGLSLDEKATEEQVDFALENLRASQASANLPTPTLASLVAAAVEAVAPPKLPPPPPEQGEFEFLRESLVHLREQDEHLAEIEGQLRKNPEMLKVASARIYSMLHRLTGTHWAPSDEPDDLADIDPDAIAL